MKEFDYDYLDLYDAYVVFMFYFVLFVQNVQAYCIQMSSVNNTFFIICGGLRPSKKM